MRMLDLFSGIGGFSLAASQVWGDELEIACFVEIDKFCQKVLNKHFPGVPIVEDVNEVERIVAYAKLSDGSELPRLRELPKEYTQPDNNNLRLERIAAYSNKFCDSSGSITRSNPEYKESKGESGRGDWGAIDLITGGFPCQPASCAGKRKGTEDSRWLWPALAAVIGAVKPRWCLLENVPGLLTIESGVLFETVCTELEDAGYEVQPLIVPAAGVGAPHRRDRVWIVAKSTESRSQGELFEQRRLATDNRRWSTDNAERPDSHALHPEVHGIGAGLCQEEPGKKRGQRSGDADSHAPDSNGGLRNGWQCEPKREKEERVAAFGAHSHATNPDRTDTNPTGVFQSLRLRSGQCPDGSGSQWDEHWYEAATRLCRVPNGVSRGVDRVNRLKALGNSVCVPVVVEILRAIKQAEDGDSDDNESDG
jgi:site-specific DNA-cytosine methylase